MPTLPSGWSLTTLDVTTGTSKFDLSLKLDDRPSGLIGRFEYNTDLFDAATIDRLVGQFGTLLAGIAAGPAQSVATLPLLPEDQQSRGAAPGMPRTRPSACDVSMTLSPRRPRARPTPSPWSMTGAHLTYAELDARANQLARYLRAARRRPGTLVAPRRRAVGRDGGRAARRAEGGRGLCAARPGLPARSGSPSCWRMRRSAVLVTQRRLLGRCRAAERDIVCLDADWPAIARAGCRATRRRESRRSDLAYVIYTSGSTGKPKGVRDPAPRGRQLPATMRARARASARDIAARGDDAVVRHRRCSSSSCR